MKSVLCFVLFLCALLGVSGSGSTYYLPLKLTICDATGCGRHENTGLVLEDTASTSAADFSRQKITSDGTTVSIGAANTGQIFLVNEAHSSYRLFNLLGMELTFDVDLHNVTCGGNAALFFCQMPTAGFATGSGYCDANGGDGRWCAEMDIIEANAYAQAVTTHPCTSNTQAGCDGWGCQINPYLMGNHNFYGPGTNYRLNANLPFTVVTQFIASGSNLVEIRRFYKQNGQIIQTPVGENENGVYGYDSINATMCTARNGGVPRMGQQLNNQVFIISFWSSSDGMGWLDEDENGPCTSEPFNAKKGSVSFGNIRLGAIGTTLLGTSTTTNTLSTTTTATATTGSTSTTGTPAPTHAPTHAPTQPPTHAPTQPPTHAPTQPPTHAPTQPPTHAPTPPPTHAPTQPPPLNVYVNSLASGWEDWSWASDYSLAYTGVYHTASDSIRFVPQNWDGIKIHANSGLNTNTYKGIQFYVHGGTTGHQLIEFDLFEGDDLVNGFTVSDIGTKISGGFIPANSWALVTILWTGPVGTYDGFWIMDNNGGAQGVLYIDDISLIHR